jgi:acetyl esterase/lipase
MGEARCQTPQASVWHHGLIGRLVTSIILLSTGLFGCSSEEPSVTTSSSDNATRIAYGEAAEQFGDLYLPDTSTGDGSIPVVVLIHGGFWRAQFDLDLMVPLAEDLTTRGFAVWNIEYRRVGQEGGGYPGTLDDVAAAIEELSQIAADHRVDLDRVGIVGHSAGGHLALWSSGAGLEVVPVVGVGQGAVVDLTLGAIRGLGGGAVVDFLGGSPAEVPDRYADATPNLTAGPRMVSVVGSDDDIVPAEFSVLGDQPGAVELVPVVGADHFDLIDRGGEAWAAVVAVLETELGVTGGE